jgi:hypothetical protein
MNKIATIIVLFMFWILYATLIHSIAKDNALQYYADAGGNTTFDKISYNTTALDESSTSNLKASSSWRTTLEVLFGFGLVDTGLPASVAVFISSINALLALVLLITIWRLIIPTGD